MLEVEHILQPRVNMVWITTW